MVLSSEYEEDFEFHFAHLMAAQKGKKVVVMSDPGYVTHH